MKYNSLIIVAGLLIITNIFWIYDSVDHAVTIDYLLQGAKNNKDSILLLRKLLGDLAHHKGKEEILKVIEAKYSYSIIKEDNGILYVDNIGFVFENSLLVNIVLLNE